MEIKTNIKNLASQTQCLLSKSPETAKTDLYDILFIIVDTIENRS